MNIKMAKTIKAVFTTILKIVMLLSLFVIGAWLLNILGDLYPSSRLKKVWMPSIERTSLFPPTFDYECYEVITGFSAETAASSDDVTNFYDQKWQKSRSGTRDPGIYAPIAIYLQVAQFYIYKSYGFSGDYGQVTVYGVSTSMYICRSKG